MRGLWALLLSTSASAAPLHLWHAYRGGEEEALQRACERFTQQTGIEVELLSVPYDALSAKLTNASPHDAGPDVFIFAHERLRQFERLQMVAPTDATLEPAAYLKPSVDALEVDGHHYGYPLSLKTLALYFNKKLIAAPVRVPQLQRRCVHHQGDDEGAEQGARV